MGWVRKGLVNFILSVVFNEVFVGGHCGCCGKWVDHDLVWIDRVTLCANCR